MSVVRRAAGSRISRKTRDKKPKKDTFDEDEENTPPLQLATSPAGSLEKVQKKDEKDHGPKFDAASCAVVKKYEETIRGMMSKGLCNYYNQHLQSYKPAGVTTVASDANAKKNRANISCYDQSRVKLALEGDRKNDYINASHVKFPDVSRKYILTQFPPQECFEDFWSMIYENDVETILSIFDPNGDVDLKEFHKKTPTTTPRAEKSEKSQQPSVSTNSDKCQKPEGLSVRETLFEMSKGHKDIASTAKRRALATSKCFFLLKEGQFVTIGKFFVHTRKVEIPDKKSKTAHLHDRSFARRPSCKVVMNMLKTISLDPLQKGPVVLQCDDGVNRSSLLLLTDVITNLVIEGKSFDIDKKFREIRQQRCGAFPNGLSFTYSILSITSYIYLRCKNRGTINPETVPAMKTLFGERWSQLFNNKKPTQDDDDDTSPQRVPASGKDRTNKRSSADAKCADQAFCANLKKFEKTIRGMMANRGLTRYYEENLQSYHPAGQTTIASDANAKKNRANISCYDQSRVKLALEGDRKNDYINASHVKFPDVSRKYILTQYPLPDALEDFWSMVFENDVETILSIFDPHGDVDMAEFQEIRKSMMKDQRSKMAPEPTTEMEASCHVDDAETAAPEALTQRETHFNMTKTHRDIAATSKRCAITNATCYFPLKEGQFVTIGKYFVHTRKIEPADKPNRPTIYTVEVLPEGCSECRFVRVINFEKWRAKGKPNVKAALAMLKSVGLDPLQKGPIVFHCDNGLNRSALLLLTDVITNLVLDGKPFDIDEKFRQIRQQRCGAFQNSFYFVHAIYSITTYICLRCKNRGNASLEIVAMMKQLLKDLGKQCPEKELV
ncbi:unnamed protein product [Caenorhabditis angaria]|uniref:Tyrosine-protein phosphatase domain-containing protein n=1 Tax=Caenorhabditis angaria TaxID=860376 RepID=A0A9P1I7W2_9PELO|nr:unnamed protein product [Caenorhabditis angaria]